jgi:hypothetical protein
MATTGNKWLAPLRCVQSTRSTAGTDLINAPAEKTLISTQ